MEENQCISLCKSDPDCKWSSLNPIKEDCTMFSDCKQINATQCEECLTNERSCVPKQCNVNGTCEVSTAQFFIGTSTTSTYFNNALVFFGCFTSS